MTEAVPAMPKQFIGQVAMDEQQPSMAFSEGSFLCGQQSMSSMEDDMFDMSADFAAAPVAAPAAVGSTATDRASKNTRIARPRCMGLPLPWAQNSRFRGNPESPSSRQCMQCAEPRMEQFTGAPRS